MVSDLFIPNIPALLFLLIFSLSHMQLLLTHFLTLMFDPFSRTSSSFLGFKIKVGACPSGGRGSATRGGWRKRLAAARGTTTGSRGAVRVRVRVGVCVRLRVDVRGRRRLKMFALTVL